MARVLADDVNIILTYKHLVSQQRPNVVNISGSGQLAISGSKGNGKGLVDDANKQLS